ncbi:hypothetical protein GCM10008179_34200 [Hansschlegelia plantiphila]|uniref:DUF3320 domain-containing protein n=2 Tax=Hansschlegelia plantiphila TaxID=374655 RepID=A0A9W6J329_9HYPH|nr:hypothetical protein GCM10008179_34200 [Hansschlegelia plantiphila]
MTSKGLQKRLLDLHNDARTLEEEQGVNILFLALGMLKWIDPNNVQNARHAPLLLVPVSLERGAAGEKFRLRARQEDVATNLSLESYLDRVHALKLPVFDTGDEFDPTAYFAAVAEAVSTKPDWAVLSDDIVLGFFSFAKFLMYRDLDADIWPPADRISDRPLIRGLLADGFAVTPDLVPEEGSIDPFISPADMLHIVDSDSSQTVAVHEVRSGRNLVIQGPPGTGKSQTIANVIASAVADGKTVLFVAEKMAALEVVKRRLDQAGVGDACLELHSNKANKRLVLEELKRTWELGQPRGAPSTSLADRLTGLRDVLNSHAERIHRTLAPSGLSPYGILGELARLNRLGQRPVDFSLVDPQSWTPEDKTERAALLNDLVQRIRDIGQPDQHPWRGVGLEVVVATALERIIDRIGDARSGLGRLVQEGESLSEKFGVEPPSSLSGFAGVADIGRRVSGAPNLSPEALAASIWETDPEAVRDALEAGWRLNELASLLEGDLVAATADAPLEGVREQFGWLPRDFGLDAFERVGRLAQRLPRIVDEAERLRIELGSATSSDTLSGADRLIETAERVAAAPIASPEAFAASVWDHGVERAGDIAEAVARFQEARAAVGDLVTDTAWETDLASTRKALALHTGPLRRLNGDWRRAHAVARTVLRKPDSPLGQQLETLDRLMAGQKALKTIRDEDAFARSAFSNDWRGERSSAAPLLTLVEWMRTLRGLGAEPRLIAGRTPERSAIGDLASQLKQLIGELRSDLRQFWYDLGSSAGPAFENVLTPERVDLRLLRARLDGLADADRRSRAAMKKPPATVEERLALIDRIVEWRESASALAQAQPIGLAAFEVAWKGEASDLSALAEAAEWLIGNPAMGKLAARLGDQRAEIARRAIEAERDADRLASELSALLADLRTDARAQFRATVVSEAEFQDLSLRLDLWLGNREQLSKWVTFRDRAAHGRALGMTALVDRLEDGRVSPDAAQNAFAMAYYDALLGVAISADPALGRFDGPLHEGQVREFANLDRQRIAESRIEVARAHHKKIPPSFGGVGPLGVLRAEMARRRGHMPIRQLMHRAAQPIQALKPVLMMSPLSVAQFLPPGQLTFDLLVMDEASQIQPVDALGAIGRCRQVVVVGDERQLPPTRFFSKMTGSGEDDEDDGAQVADIESILGLFHARGLPQRMLRWHYRSRHQSLIAVSNSQFYEDKLYIVPSPYTREAGMGLQFHLVPNGVFDSGGTTANLIEAKAVAQAIIQHAKSNPELSLGVATFSIKQRRAIQDEVEILRRKNPDIETFLSAHPSEPFFIKNLENVQGDERDVILISVGYAKNAQGQMAMRFGPLSAEGGERRLNVLISRAKRRCEVYASITDEDIDLERGKGKGVLAFKLFLNYARTGQMTLQPGAANAGPEILEAQVAEALKARGYQVHPRVGVAGLFIDLAIADQEHPGRYLLGVECDSRSYAGARSARDRDRLRQTVLEDHGWIIRRVWSVDWFQRPQEELNRLCEAIEAAKVELAERLEASAARQRAVDVEIVTVDRGDFTEVGLSDVAEDGLADRFYVEASPRAHLQYELHETPVGMLAELVVDVVSVEGPVHIDEAVARIRSAWGLQRSGGRIQAAVERAAEIAVRSGRVALDGQFLRIPDARVTIRDRRDVLSTTLRKPEMLPPIELQEAVRHVVTTNFGATREEVVVAVSRLLGFKATSAQLRDVILAQVERLVADETLSQADGLLVGRSSTDPHERSARPEVTVSA